MSYHFISYRFRDIVSYLSKAFDFSVPHLHLVNPFEFCRDLYRVRKQRLSPWAIVWRCLRDPTLSRFSIEHRLVTDGQHSTMTIANTRASSVTWVKKSLHKLLLFRRF